MKTAVIIHGNPFLINGNSKADLFYKEIEAILLDLGFNDVNHDPGEPYTVPKKADLWIAHSRGVDRLRFAPEKTLVIGLGAYDSGLFIMLNHPDDEMTKELIAFDTKEDVINKKYNDSFHYVLDEKMREKLISAIEKARQT